LSHATEEKTKGEKGEVSHGTVERFSVTGAAYKRLAIVTTGAKRGEALQRMAEYYQHACLQAEQAGKVDYYPIHNYVLAQQIIHALYPKLLVKGMDMTALLDKVDLLLRERSNEDSDFWSIVAATDQALTRHLAED